MWQSYWHAQYGALARELPAWLDIARATARDATGPAVRAVHAQLASLLQLTASLLAQLAHEDLAHLALAGAVRAAEDSGDELLHAAGQATRSWILARQGLWSEAEYLALTTASAIEPTLSTASVDHVAVWGDLLRYGAVALGRSGRHSETADVLGLMHAAASRMNGDQPTRYASRAFGPTIVAMREVDSAILAGKPRQAITLAERITHPHNTPPGMHARYLLNLAWAQTSEWRSADAVLTLRKAEELAPQLLPHQSIARTIIAELLPRRRKQRLPGLVALAERVGVPTT